MLGNWMNKVEIVSEWVWWVVVYGDMMVVIVNGILDVDWDVLLLIIDKVCFVWCGNECIGMDWLVYCILLD